MYRPTKTSRIFLLCKKIQEQITSPANRIEILFATIAFVAGLTMALLIPPMQGADEHNHFFRSYQLAQGHILPQNQATSVGGEIPKDVIALSSLGLDLVRPGSTSDKLTPEEWQKMADVPNDNRPVSATFSNTAIYSPVAYAPRSLAIWMAGLFDASPMTLMYVSRIVGLLVAIAIITLAIKLLPFGKLPAAIIGLIPMSLSQLAIISADTMVISLSFLAVALTLHYSFRAQSLRLGDFGWLLLVFAALSLTKPALFPLATIAFALLANKQIPKLRAIGVIIAVCFVSLAATWGWNALVQEFAVRGFEADVSGVNYHDQMQFILTQPIEYAKVIFRTLFTERFDNIPQQLIGSFGWVDTRLPYLFVIITFVLIGCSILVSSLYEKVVMPRWVRFVAFLGGLGVIAVTFTSQYLFWISVQKMWNDGLQGRYFLPAAPIIALSLIAGRSIIDDVYYLRLVHRIFLVAGLIVLVSLAYIAARYYGVFGFLTA